MKTTTLLTAAMTAAVIFTPVTALADRGERAAKMMERIDTDKNGAISLEEFTTARAARFDAADANKDGAITREEMMAQIEKRRMERRVNRMFERLDADNDGTITKAETAAFAEKRFARLDRDNSGSIEKSEMRRLKKRDRKSDR